MQKIISLAQVIKDIWPIKKQQKVKNMGANLFVPKFTLLTYHNIINDYSFDISVTPANSYIGGI